MLQKKMAEAAEVEDAPEAGADFDWRDESPEPRRRTTSRRSTRARRPRQTVIERTVQNVARQATRTVTQQIVRGIFGLLKGR